MPETAASNLVSSVHCKLLLDSLICNTSFDVPCSMYRVRQKKSGPLNFFAVFSATVWDFNTKFYSFIY